MARRKEPKKDRLEELVDEMISDCENPEDLLGRDGLVKQMTKKLVERMLQAEMTDHLGYEKHDPAGRGSGNSRNGSSAKTLKSEHGSILLEIPRDRRGRFEPQVVAKGQTRSEILDEKILSLYARGMSTRDIRDQIEELYGVAISPTLVSEVTDAVLDEVKTWQSRPLDAIYPIVYLDAIRVKIRDDHTIKNKAVYLALGVNIEGEKELLGLWIAQNEGAKFWMGVLTELKNRGLQDIFIACVDGLTGFPEAIETLYPQTQVQLCIVHQVRNSLKFVAWKDRKAVAADLKKIYQAKTLEEAETQLDAFATQWDEKYSTISQSWRSNWEHLTPFFAYPEEIRRVIYTTNAIESMNRSLRKILKTRGSFPHDDAVRKLIYLALRNITKKWTKPIKNWKAALNQFAILFDDRVVLP